MRTLVKVVLGVVAALVLLVGALILVLQSGAAAERVKNLVVPRASAALGRELTVQGAALRLFPHAHVSLTGASIAGRPGEPAMVSFDELQIDLRLWPLIASFGKDVEIAGIRIDRPVVNLVRSKDGTWNYEGVGAAGPAKQKSAPSQTEVVVDHFILRDGSVALHDALAGANAQVAVSKIDLDAQHVGVGQPLSAKLSAALAGDAKNFEATVKVAKLPASVAGLGPGEWPEVAGDLALKGLDLGKLRAFLPPSFTGMMTGGRVDSAMKLATQAGKYAVDGTGKVSQLRMRGQPAEASFQVHALVDPATNAGRAALEKLSVKGPGVDLGGSVTVDLKPQRVRFALGGPLLDLGEVLGAMPDAPKAKKPAGGEVLTPAQRKSLEALDVAGTLDIAKVVKGGLVATAFKARAVLEKGVFVLHEARADAFGGRIDASGTKVDLGEALPRWSLATKLEGVDLGQALTSLAGSAPLVGKTSGTLALDGEGVEWASLENALTGHGALALKDGALTTTDLGAKVLGAVSQGLRAAGKGGAADKVGGVGGKTALRDLSAQFTVKDGAMALARPLAFAAPFGAAQLGGKIGLGGELGLQGTATLSKEALSGIAGRMGIPLKNGLQVPLGLGGTLFQPSVNVDAQGAVTNLVFGVARAKVDELTGGARKKAEEMKGDATKRVQEEAKKGIGDVLKGLGR